MSTHVEDTNVLALINGKPHPLPPSIIQADSLPANARLLFGRTRTYDVTTAQTAQRARALLIGYEEANEYKGRVLQYGESLATTYSNPTIDQALLDLHQKLKELVAKHLGKLGMLIGLREANGMVA
tara:strand:- start:39871 stop:40248 length:378 start_codon:yes stop_codon:yes gene_type:complete